MNAVAAGSSAVTPVHPQHKDVLLIPLLAGTPVLKQPIAMSRMKQLRTRREPSHTGRARSLSAMNGKKIVRTAERMIEYANGEWQDTAEMVNKALKVNCCVRVVLSMSRGLCENVRFCI